jgi:pantoate--beta-alanine ligase
LVQRARELADRVLVSIFVNPLQFAEGEDLDAYPRTMAADQAHLRELAVDLLFAPPVEELYHRPREEETRVLVPGISEILCGASRPGHFTGVATVVCKLFNMAQPDVAVFGEKDYQQLQVIRRMVEDLQIPVTIEGVPTVREADGLAMSSRNGYLTADERARAPALYQALQQAAADLQRGERDYARIEARAIAALENAGLRPDYFQIRRAADLQPPAADEPALVLLAAAYLGRARLIDNLQLTLGAGRT